MTSHMGIFHSIGVRLGRITDEVLPIRRMLSIGAAVVGRFINQVGID
jgi:hypothetical protein